jgi:hypothetical protein
MGNIFSTPPTSSTLSTPSTPPLHEFRGRIKDASGVVDITVYLGPDGLCFKVVYPNLSDIESITFQVVEDKRTIKPDFEDPYMLHSTALTVHVTCKGADGYSRTITMECYHGDTCDCDFDFDIAALAKQASALGYECEYNPVSNISQMRGSLEHGSLTLSLPSTAPPLVKVEGNSASCTVCTA